MRKLTTEEFIEKAKKVHGKRYDYSLVDYQYSQTKVKIICPEHGVFEQEPNAHLSGQGCRKCSLEQQIIKQRSNLEDFIKKANIVHNNQYDYSLVDYIDSKSKVKIICKQHGIFEQKPNGHLNGNICPKCRANFKLTLLDFINKANIIHNNKYDYSLVAYKNSKSKVKIICPEHGVFEQTPSAHLSGQGCKKCSGHYKLSLPEFIEKCQNIHNNKYDYSLIKEYRGLEYKLDIICPEHGLFQKLAISHLNGTGCPKCSNNGISKGEKEVLEYIKSIYSGLILENTKEIIKPYELDIFLPDLKIAIEYNGEYWHQLHESKKPGYHQLKEKLCKEQDIKLINIWENKWINNQDEIRKLLFNAIIK